MVPFANVNSVGMRPVVRNGEIEKIVDYLSSGECINAADWKDRFKENSDRMRTGSLTDVAAVLKSLLILGQAKSLSFREKKDAGAGAVFAGQRDCHLAQLRRKPD